jgi:hypothetical protein
MLQTGSGKTFSMMGDDKNPGIIPMMNQDLFARVEAGVADGRKFLVIVSYLEIYNEARRANAQPGGCTEAPGRIWVRLPCVAFMQYLWLCYL